MSKSDRVVRSDDKDELLRGVLEQCDGEEATVFLCRGSYAACQTHLKGPRKRGKPSCQWCAIVDVTHETTVEGLKRSMRMDA